jgi:hypothetical protein
MDAETVGNMLRAQSVGAFYDQYIGGKPNFDCRLHPAPDYDEMKLDTLDQDNRD